MPSFCYICRVNFRSLGGLTKHMNSKHNKNSTLAGMAEASQLHTFIRHPTLSGEYKLICNFLYIVLNTYEPGDALLMAHSSEIPFHRHHKMCLSQAATLGTPSVTGSNTNGRTTTTYGFNPRPMIFSVALTSGEQPSKGIRLTMTVAMESHERPRRSYTSQLT